MKAETYLEEIESALVPVPAVQPGICRTCRSVVSATYERCFPCDNGLPVGFEVTPILMEEEGALAHRHLRGYKAQPDEAARKIFRTRLAAVVALFLGHHADCLGDFDMIATVASTSSNRDSPREIAAMVKRLSGLPNVGLHCTDPDLPSFAASLEVSGQRVLVFDDTFTTGATIAAACSAIETAGGTVVGPLVIGRYVTNRWKPSRPMMEYLRQVPFDISTCIHCSPTGGVVIDPPLQSTLL